MQAESLINTACVAQLLVFCGLTCDLCGTYVTSRKGGKMDIPGLLRHKSLWLGIADSPGDDTVGGGGSGGCSSGQPTGSPTDRPRPVSLTLGSLPANHLPAFDRHQTSFRLHKGTSSSSPMTIDR